MDDLQIATVVTTLHQFLEHATSVPGPLPPSFIEGMTEVAALLFADLAEHPSPFAQAALAERSAFEGVFAASSQDERQRLVATLTLGFVGRLAGLVAVDPERAGRLFVHVGRVYAEATKERRSVAAPLPRTVSDVAREIQAVTRAYELPGEVRARLEGCVLVLEDLVQTESPVDAGDGTNNGNRGEDA